MKVKILIPTPLRRFVEGAKSVEVEAATVEAALAALGQRNADLRKQIFDDAGHLRNFVNVFLGDRNARELGASLAEVPVRDGDVLVLIPAIAGGTPEVKLSREEILRYSRHLIIPEVTIEGQKRLKASMVLCIGAGGLVSPLTLYLAAAGVGRIGVVDFDTVDLTNIQRQILYSTGDVGRPKVEAARERLEALNPNIEIVTHSIHLASWNVMDLFGAYDIIADGTDNFPTRYLVNDACVLLRKPNVYGSIFRFEGQISVFDAARGPCYRCLFPEPPPPGLVPSCAEGGVLGVLPGIIGSLQALEVLKLILGVGEPLIGRFVVFDALDFKFRELSIAKNKECAVCGASPTVTAPVDYEAFCQVRGAESEADLGQASLISVEELHQRRDAGEKFRLLDVREPHERKIVSIPDSIHTPFDELLSRLHEFDSADQFVVYCHKTGRSLDAWRLLRKAGFGNAYVLSGGVDAWAQRIDPTLPRY